MWFYNQKEVSLHFDNCFLCAQQKKRFANQGYLHWVEVLLLHFCAIKTLDDKNEPSRQPNN